MLVFASECESESETADVAEREGEYDRGAFGGGTPSVMLMVARRRRESGSVSFMVIVLSLSACCKNGECA